MTQNHVHDMQPDRPVKPTVYGCSSCAFRCTPRVVNLVRANPRQHSLVRAKDPQAKIIWDNGRA
jgi:hypothetical protein